MQQAKNLTSSGHPYLDAIWTTDGADDRNHCYRRQYYRFNKLLAQTLGPKTIVELGIDEGVSCAHFAVGCPTATVIGIDIHKDWEAPSLKCQALTTIFKNFRYLRAWTWAAVDAITEPIDILFIDSWHDPDYFARDWNDYSKLLYPGSVVLIDDLHVIDPSWRQLPYQKFVDAEMNPGIPFGVLIYDGKPTVLPHRLMEFMPKCLI